MKKTIVLRRGIISVFMVLVLVVSVVPGISMISSDSSRNRPDDAWNIEYVGFCPTTRPEYNLRENHPNKIVVKENYAYVTSYAIVNNQCPDTYGVLDVIDISNPEQPLISGNCHGNYPLHLGIPQDIIYYEDLNNKNVFIGNIGETCSGDTHYTILKFDVTNPSNPQEGVIEEIVQYGPFSTIALASQQDTLYALRQTLEMPPNGLLDMGILPYPINQEEDFLLQYLGPIYDMQIKTNYLYITGRINNFGPALIILDITDPTVPQICSITHCAISHSLALLTTGNIKYVSYALLGTDTGVQIVDVRDPNHPSYKGAYTIPGPTSFICTSGPYAYVSSKNYGITILDISYPDHPLPAGYYTTDVNATALSIKGDLIFATNDDATDDTKDGLVILRFTENILRQPSRPSGIIGGLIRPMDGIVGVEYDFIIRLSRTHINEYPLFLWSWGDKTFSEWLGPFHDGEIVQASHTWTTPGEYLIRVKVRGTDGVESPWSIPLIVTIW